jgi:hypothetical protein
VREQQEGIAQAFMTGLDTAATRTAGAKAPLEASRQRPHARHLDPA